MPDEALRRNIEKGAEIMAILTFIAVLIALIIAISIVGGVIHLIVYMAENHAEGTAFSFLAVAVTLLAFFITKEVIR